MYGSLKASLLCSTSSRNMHDAVGTVRSDTAVRIVATRADSLGTSDWAIELLSVISLTTP
jgi:hypothetical protein